MNKWPTQSLWTDVIIPSGEPPSPRQQAALRTLLQRYHAAICAQIRWAASLRPSSNLDPDELANMFCEKCLSKERFFATVDRNRGSFRGWLKVVLRNFVFEQARRCRDDPRTSGSTDVLGQVPDNREEDPEKQMDRAWVRTTIERAQARHRAYCRDIGKEREYEILLDYFDESREHRMSMEELAAKLGKANGATRMAASRFREKFCQLIAEEVHDYSGSQEEFEDEMRGSFNHCWRWLRGG